MALILAGIGFATSASAESIRCVAGSCSSGASIAFSGPDIVTAGPGLSVLSTGSTGRRGRGASLIRGSRAGGSGSTGPTVTINSSGNITTTGSGAFAIRAFSQGGAGGRGGGSGCCNASDGGKGGNGGSVSVRGSGDLSMRGPGAIAILAVSQAGKGGKGGNGGTFGGGGDGGGSGLGGSILVDGSWNITTRGNDAHGIAGYSLGAEAGRGGKNGAIPIGGGPGSGGNSGSGGSVTIRTGGDIATTGSDSHGAIASSVGGHGGRGGGSAGFVSFSASGGSAGHGGSALLTNTGAITTRGARSHAIFSESVGGGGGSGGSGFGVFYSSGGGGGRGGNGGTAFASNAGMATTIGANSHGIFAQSVGGGGGSGGGSGGAFSFGGSGSGGGSGAGVTARNTGSIEVSGAGSRGIFAQSVGGGGGDGAFSGGILAVGGRGSSTSPGGNVLVENSGNISATGSNAIFAQSVGGGGGNGGASGGWFGVGGAGGGGGNGGIVTVNETGQLSTQAADSSALFVQSVGGGGGNGGGTIAVGAFFSAGVGGSGGTASDGGRVDVNATAGGSSTMGARSHGIFAQSVGGGGGNGGFAGSVAIGTKFAVGVAIGGKAGGGGKGGSVDVQSGKTIQTLGKDAHGIQAQSVGGGGGNGGFAIAAAGSDGFSGTISVGGSGGAGGDASTVVLGSDGDITTGGLRSYGILAQSVGGGGGDGGFSIGASFAAGPAAALSFGGSGTAGGAGGTVDVDVTSDITTSGELAHGVVAQSVGGGGGSGGFAISGAGSSQGGGLAFGMGGSGAKGGNANQVDLDSAGTVKTQAKGAHGLIAQSVGGGGGNAGFAGTISGGFGDGASLSAAIGGTGGPGGDGGRVHLGNTGTVTTAADAAYGVFAQSVGGGGGDGGFAMAVALGQGEKSVTLSAAVGGSGGVGGEGKAVGITNQGFIETSGVKSHGLFAQSLGGGGGTGGFAASGSLSSTPSGVQLGVSVGGSGGTGTAAGRVDVSNQQSIITHGESALGIYAHSLGGGGGDGGLSFSGAFGAGTSKNLAVSVGGAGGSASSGGFVSVINDGLVDTSGHNAHAIQAQSVGGGGGNGGMAIAATLGSGGEKTNVNASIAVGGSGGAGNKGGTVEVTTNDRIVTRGDDAHGIFAQSVGGGGGTGGSSLAGSVGLSAAQPGKSINVVVAVGGAGGSGNTGGAVNVQNTSLVDTFGRGSVGIVAQSVGGGGGMGGSARGVSLLLDKKNPFNKNASQNANLQIAVGGSGGMASDGGTVFAGNSGVITTRGIGARGIFAQSVGGGGGRGGMGIFGLPVPVSLANQISLFKDISITVGGDQGSQGNGGIVTVRNAADIVTMSSKADGIFAQSVGGGGGVGENFCEDTAAGDPGPPAGTAVCAPPGSGGTAQTGVTAKLSIGGDGSNAGFGAMVDVEHTGTIETFGNGANGIFAQSVGGGGGVAGNVDRGLKDGTLLGIELGFSNIGILPPIGGSGGGGGDGGLVTIQSSGDIVTHGSGANAIFAQSVGGGGGVAGNIGNNLISSDLFSAAGSSGGAGSGGNVVVDHSGDIVTFGDVSHGVFAQSAGGTGSGGDVMVTVDGNIAANGLGSDGVVVQSRGDAGVGDVTVTLLGAGVVQGGTGDAAGVRFLDGGTNVVANGGLLHALGGTAVAGGTGDDSVDNTGTVVGDLRLGTGANVFDNRAGASFRAGPVADLGGGRLTNAGTVQIENATPATTQLNGRFEQTPTGRYIARFHKDGSRDLIAATGTAAIGGTLEVVRNPGFYADQLGDFVLTTPQTSGALAALDIPTATPLLRFDVSVQPGGVFVDPVAQPFASIARNKVQRATSTYLDAVVPVRTPSLDLVLGEFQMLQPHQYEQALASLSGDSYDDYTTTTLSTTERYGRALLGGIGQAREVQRRFLADLIAKREAVDPVTGLSPVGANLFDTRGVTFWTAGFNGSGEQRKDDGYTGYDFDGYGGLLGASAWIDETSSIGISGGWSRSRLDLHERRGDGAVRSGYGSIYGSWFSEDRHVEGAITYARHRYDSERPIQIGNIAQTAYSEHGGASLGLTATAGWNTELWSFAATPYVALEAMRLWERGFTERGAEDLNLVVNARTTDSLVGEVGVRMSRRIVFDGGSVSSGFVIGWRHDFDIDDRTVRSGFAAVPTRYSLDGRDIESNSGRAGLEIRFEQEDGPFSAALQLDSLFRNGSSERKIGLRLGYLF